MRPWVPGRFEEEERDDEACKRHYGTTLMESGWPGLPGKEPEGNGLSVSTRQTRLWLVAFEDLHRGGDLEPERHEGRLAESCRPLEAPA
jgi:hypothetical protein